MHHNIPIDFFSDMDGHAFTHCKVCGCDLSDGHVPYTIEKAYKRVDDKKDVTLFEMVLCMPCAEKQSLKMSKQSRAYMEKMLNDSDFMDRRLKRWETNWEKNWKETCLFTGSKIKINDEYHVVGQFQGDKILPQLTPFVLGQNFIEELQENLSIETKEEMDRFGKQFLGPDPTLKALLGDYQFVMV